MKTIWILVFAAIALSATCVSGNDCNVTLVSPCFETITEYETFAFPLFGQDDVELDETCSKIDDTKECIHSYVDGCKDQPKCDENCKEQVNDIEAFSNNTGLYDLHATLCDPDSKLRKFYLENYVCLEDNREKYATCHNDSQNSQLYISSIDDAKESLLAHCCYFSWYTTCIKNATETCRDDAIAYVSFGLSKLIGQVKEKLCKETTIRCEMPPQSTEDQHHNEPSPPEAKSDRSNNSSHFFVSTCHRVILLISVLSSKYLFAIH